MSETTTTVRDDSAAFSRAAWVYAAAVFSAGAGLVHASAAGQHSEHWLLATLFAVAAAAQVGWALAAFTRPGRLVLQLGLALQLVLIGFWGLTRLSSVSAIDGLESVQPVGRQDLLTIALEALAVVATLVALRSASRSASTPKRSAVALAIATAVAVAIAVPASATQDGQSHGTAASAGHDSSSAATGKRHAPSVAIPYDPTQPIDLGGVPGVTPEQQATAENIVAVALNDLPQWSDPAVAEAAGFHTIGDGATGTEHFVNEEFMNDDVTLDPDRPESLVYDTTGGGRRLVAAMYMEKRGLPLEDVPNLGGALMQWHTHENLCYNAAGRVAGLTDSNGNCRAGLTKPEPTPMIHVWIQSHPCGPFAALEGIGGGTIPEGEEKLCDAAHGA